MLLARLLRASVASPPTFGSFSRVVLRTSSTQPNTLPRFVTPFNREKTPEAASWGHAGHNKVFGIPNGEWNERIKWAYRDQTSMFNFSANPWTQQQKSRVWDHKFFPIRVVLIVGKKSVSKKAVDRVRIRRRLRAVAQKVIIGNPFLRYHDFAIYANNDECLECPFVNIVSDVQMFVDKYIKKLEQRKANAKPHEAQRVPYHSQPAKQTPNSAHPLIDARKLYTSKKPETGFKSISNTNNSAKDKGSNGEVRSANKNGNSSRNENKAR